MNLVQFDSVINSYGCVHRFDILQHFILFDIFLSSLTYFQSHTPRACFFSLNPHPDRRPTFTLLPVTDLHGIPVPSKGKILPSTTSGRHRLLVLSRPVLLPLSRSSLPPTSLRDVPCSPYVVPCSGTCSPGIDWSPLESTWNPWARQVGCFVSRYCLRLSMSLFLYSR